MLAIVLALLLGGCNAVRYGWPDGGAEMREAELVLTLGPVDLAPGSDHAAAPQPAQYHAVLPANAWARGFTVELLDARGDTVPAAVLHHTKIVMPGRRELFEPMALRLLGAGSETRSAEIPPRMGVPLGRGDSLIATAMVHNPTDRHLEGVRIRIHLRYATSAGPRGIDDVYPFFLHVTPPDAPTSSFDLPPGYSERSWEARPAVGGRILSMGGHLHRYGVSLRMEDAATGRVIWRVRPVTDSLGHVLDVPRTSYVWTRGPRLRPDRVYRVTASYFNPTAETIVNGGMGTVGGVFRPDSAWPVRDADDPLYILDQRREREDAHGHGHGPGPGQRHEHRH